MQPSTFGILKFLCLLTILVTPISFSEAKKGGGGGGRGGGGGFGGGNPSGGRVGAPPVAAPAPAGGRVGGAPVAPPVSKSGSGSRFGTGLAVGAVGGLAAGVLGAQIAHSIAAGSTGGYHDGRYYYYGDRNYPGPNPGYVKCTLQVGADFNATYKDGQPIKELIYECNRATDTCCANGCCPITVSNSNVVSTRPVYRAVNIWSIIIPLLVLLIAIGVICFFVVKCIRRRRREAASNQQVYYDAGGAQTVVQPGDKQWAPQQPQQPYYYPPQPSQQPSYVYPAPQAPPPAYSNYGHQGQQPPPPGWKPS